MKSDGKFDAVDCTTGLVSKLIFSSARVTPSSITRAQANTSDRVDWFELTDAFRIKNATKEGLIRMTPVRILPASGR